MVSSSLTLIIVPILICVSLVAAISLTQPKNSYPSVNKYGNVRERDDTSELITSQGGYNTGIWKFTMSGYPDSYSVAINCRPPASHRHPQASNNIAYPGFVHLGHARDKYVGGDGSYDNLLEAAAYLGSQSAEPSSHCTEVLKEVLAF